MSEDAPYVLDDQVGYLMRLASQRHAAIFQAHMPQGLTPTQFAMLMRLGEVGCGSQNQLGRLTAMDVATAKGVVDRLLAKGLVTQAPDETDGRRHVIALSAEGERLLPELKRIGRAITRETLEPLGQRDRTTLLRLLRRLG
ncbi:MAG: MarR family transcriptional regulator [Pseudomonadota bacterium]